MILSGAESFDTITNVKRIIIVSALVSTAVVTVKTQRLRFEESCLKHTDTRSIRLVIRQMIAHHNTDISTVMPLLAYCSYPSHCHAVDKQLVPPFCLGSVLVRTNARNAAQ